MVIDVKAKLPNLERIKVSRVVLISGALAFLYLIEFCIGIRSVYNTFSLWNGSHIASQSTQSVSWTLCVACLLVCVGSAFTVNLISAMWEQKQLKERGTEKSAIRFAFHIIVGGIIWRYVCLWFSEKKESQKQEAMLLAMAKFLFTQFYTIPVMIVHASLLEDFEEILYDLCAVTCISVTLLLMCITFSWCRNEVDDLKKWNFETVNLVPLIFCEGSEDSKKSEGPSKTETNKESADSQEETTDDAVETAFVRVIVLLQNFCFTFGRLLALGVLLKLAGIYAVSIMFLQLLISVVYLKFQVPLLVSDSLPKWRQLTRLAFMSYNLIFEWHLNRDPKTGYDFTSNIKHSMLYYIIATLESIFYFITWAITDNYSSNGYLDNLLSPKRKFVRNLAVTGSLSLVLSLAIYFLLMFWQSRRLSKLFNSLQRRYLSSKLKMTNSGRDWMKRKSEHNSPRSKADISNPFPLGTLPDDDVVKNASDKELEKHSSYRDLREPIDDEIEVYARKREVTNISKVGSEKAGQETKITSVKSSPVSRCSNVENNPNERNFDTESNDYEAAISETESNPTESNSDPPAVIDVNENKREINKKYGNIVTSSNNGSVTLNSNENESTEKESPKTADSTASSVKSRITIFSENMNVSWNKISSLSRKFTGAMQEHIQKRKEQYQNSRSSSHQENKLGQQPNEKPPSTDTDQEKEITSTVTEVEKSETFPTEPEYTEGYFMGDSRCNDEEFDYSTQEEPDICKDVKPKKAGTRIFKSVSVVNLHEEVQDSEPVHCEGDEPCPCFVCKTIGDGQILRRRRSSSVPPADRKVRCNLSPKIFPKETSVSSSASSSNSVQVDMKDTAANSTESGEQTQRINFATRMYPKGSFQNLRLASSKDRVEHYV